MNFDSLFAERLKEERKRLGLDQAAAGASVAVSREMWGKYERGAAMPGGEVLRAFAMQGADIQYVLTGARSSVALAPEERILLDRFRVSGQPLKDAALRVLLGGTVSEVEAKTVVHQNFAGAEIGSQTSGPIRIKQMTVGGSKKK